MAKRTDCSRSAGGAALAARLRRLSERLDRDGTRIYATRGVRFEQRWYGVLNQILLNGPMAVGEIASALRITHVSVSQASRSLESAGLVQSLPDAEDARRRRLALTDEGEHLTQERAPLWLAFNDTAEALNAEAGDIVSLLERIEAVQPPWGTRLPRPPSHVARQGPRAA